MGVFHTDFGTIAVAQKCQCYESVDASGAMGEFFQSGKFRKISVEDSREVESTSDQLRLIDSYGSSQVLHSLFLSKVD